MGGKVCLATSAKTGGADFYTRSHYSAPCQKPYWRLKIGRPRKPVALHLIQNTFRPHRHAHLLPTAPEPALTPPEPRQPGKGADADADEWDFFLETGICETGAQQGLWGAEISMKR